MNIKNSYGIFVAVDDLNNIIGFHMDLETVKEYANWYNDILYGENKRIIRVVDPETRLYSCHASHPIILTCTNN